MCSTFFKEQAQAVRQSLDVSLTYLYHLSPFCLIQSQHRHGWNWLIRASSRGHRLPDRIQAKLDPTTAKGHLKAPHRDDSSLPSRAAMGRKSMVSFDPDSKRAEWPAVCETEIERASIDDNNAKVQLSLEMVAMDE